MKSKISELKSGDGFAGTVKVIRKLKPGPTILAVTDGMSTIDAVSKESVFGEGDIIDLEGVAFTRNNRLQLEIVNAKKSDKDFSSLVRSFAEPAGRSLSVSSGGIDKAYSHIIKAAKRLRLAALEGQPVIIRHHADADGIASAVAIEKALRLFMEKHNKKVRFSLLRFSSKLPYYDISDMLRDVSFSQRVLNASGSKKPLVLLLDNGSTQDDLLALKALNSLGYEAMVIDHHNPGEIRESRTQVCPFLCAHINPYLYGLDSNITAGMLSYETARLIHERFDSPALPAVSALGDKSESAAAPEYIKNSGLDKEELQRIVLAVDYLAYHLRHDSGENIFLDILENKKFQEVIYSEASSCFDSALGKSLPNRVSRSIGEVILSTVDLGSYSAKGSYPPAGRLLGRIHEKNLAENPGRKIITAGALTDMLIIRESEIIIEINGLVQDLKKEFPDAVIEGGGHENAGTIKFSGLAHSDILSSLKRKLENRNYSGGDSSRS